MPEKTTTARAQRAKRAGKPPSTQAGAFVREEIEHVRAGKHGACSARPSIAIGLSKARRAGVALPPPKRGSRATKKAAERDAARGESATARKASPTRSRAAKRALARASTRAASRGGLSAQAKPTAAKRPIGERSAAAAKGARSRSAASRSASAQNAARTRAGHG